ncbi:MAG: hypothetical protein C0401_01275 [Anaerolinea sp.]|nr:hypothetical protein [Anaerolinea sp.]
MLINEESGLNKNIDSLNQPTIESLLGIIPGVVYRCENDKDRLMEFLSEGCYQLTGYPADSFTGIKEISFAGLIHPEDFQRTWEKIQAALSENHPFKISYRIRHASGEYRSVLDQGKGVVDQEGKVIALEGWIIDNTEQKKAEEALINSESCYRNLVESSPDAVILVDLKGTILLSNQQLGIMLGVEDNGSLVGKKIVDFLGPATKQISKKEITQFFAEENTHRGSYQIQTVDGKVFPAEISIRAIYGPDSNPTAYVGVVRDVSPREDTLQTLKTSEARYRSIVEESPEMIVRFAPNGKVTFANQAYCNYYGMVPDQLIGNRLSNVLPTGSKKSIERLLSSITPDMAPVTKEHSAQQKNGEMQWYRWKTQPIRNDEGQFIEYQSVGENITDEKKAQNAEIHSERYLRTLMESIKLIAIILDPHGKLTFCNSHFLETTGWTRKEAIGKNWLEYFVPTDVAYTLKKVLIESSLHGNVPQRYENMIVTRKGEQRLISWNNTLLTDDHGITTAIASIGEDITEKFYSEKTQEVIYKIAQSTISSGDLNELFRSIHLGLMDLMPAENFFIALYDAESDILSFPYFVDQFDSQPAPKKPGKGLTEYVLQTGKPLLVNPEVFNLLVEENEVESIGAPSVDWMGVPLLIENQVIGVMGAQTYSEGIRFKKRDEQMITFVSTQVAMAIERKRAEQALKSSKQRNELLVQASTDGIFLETLAGEILDCNRIAEQMYGYSREEFMALHVTDLVLKEYVIDKPDYVKWQLDQGGRIGNVPNIRKDGTVFPVEISTKITGIEGDKFVVAYVRDVTEQKKAENAILESEAKFRALAQTTAAGIFIHRAEQFLYVNPRWCEITGYSEQELLKMSLWDTVTQDELPVVKQKYEDRIRGNSEIVRYETAIFTKKGEKKWLDITAGFIDYQGEKSTIGTAIDITYRKQREHELEVVAHISDALRTTLSREEIRPTILRELMDLLEIDGAIISTIEKGKELSTFERAVGCWYALDKLSLKVSDGLSGFIVVSGKPYSNFHASHDPHFAFPELVHNLTSIAGVPLITKGETIGSLLIGSARVLTDNELRLLKTIGDLAASAIHRSDLYEQTSLQAQELKQAYDATLEGWAHALELRDKETQGHSIRIANMTLKLAKRMGYKDEDLENVRRGALLHDIGKMGVPDTILLKPGSLSEDEWTIMQKHPAYAYDMLSELQYFKEALDIPYCHHEWWDGTGYPRGLKGTEIPLVARIFAIVDAWDALVSDRPYRKAWVKRTALKHIIDQAGTHFDVEVVNNFVQILKEEEI